MKRAALGSIFLGIMVTLLLLSGCSGGGSDTSTIGANSADTGTGTVALFLTDGPADDYDHIWIQISRAVLLPSHDGQPVVIYEPDSPEKLDLLDLRQEDEDDAGLLLALEQVPAGSYDKIRLEIISVQGEKITAAGSSEITPFRLPSGKIDLNPRGPFIVADGITLTITLDLDCDKSIHISGNQINFRSVVFVKIQPLDGQPLCPRVLHGTIDALTYAEDTVTVVGFELALQKSQSLVNILIDANTVFINDLGQVVDAQALAVDDSVYVRGHLQDDGLLASMVVVGDLVRHKGIVAQAVENDQFVLDPYSDTQSDDLVVELLPETLILWGCDQPLDPSAIQPGMVARVIGKGIDDRIIAVAVLLRPRLIAGDLTAIEPTEGGHQLTVNVTPEADSPTLTAVFLPLDAPIRIKYDGDLSLDRLEALVEVCDYPRTVQIPIDRTASETLTGAKVVVVPEPLWVTVLGVDADQRLLTTDSGLVHVKADARILDFDFSEDIHQHRNQIDLTDIQIDDQLMLHGLPLCQQLTESGETPVDFEATLVMIVPPNTTGEE